MLPEIVAFLVLLNPFAMFLYLRPVMRELSKATFAKVLLKASVISFAFFLLFAMMGEFLFNSVFQINFEAFRIFGGIVVFTFAFLFIVQGRESMITMKEDLNDLASEIALPFMVGAATITLSIIIGKKFTLKWILLSLAIVMVLNYIFIMLLHFSRQTLPKRLRIAFDKNMEVLLRLNGFFIGAIGVNMIVTGVNTLYF